MSLAVVTLKKGEGRFLKSGGLWVYDNEIATIMGSFVNGDIVLVHDFDGYPMGRGFINVNSKIRVRMLTRKIDHMGQRSIREKVMAYLSFESERQKKQTFTIPYNRQQLADYLAVDRSALSAELSRMKKDGLIRFEKNCFQL